MVPLALQVEVCSRRLQNSLQSASDSLSQALVATENTGDATVSQERAEGGQKSYSCVPGPFSSEIEIPSWTGAAFASVGIPQAYLWLGPFIGRLPTGSRIMADARTSRDERATADLKNIMLTEFVKCRLLEK